MTSMDRVLAALAGKSQARPPFALALSLYGARLSNCPLELYFRDGHRYALGQQAVYHTFAPDILFSPFALTLEAEAFGSDLVFLPDYAPNIRKPAVHSADAFLDLHLPDVDTHPSLLYLRHAVRAMHKNFGGEVPICGMLTASVDLPAMIMGIDLWLETLLFAGDKAAAILARCAAHFSAMANALLSDGATFIGIPAMFTNPRLLYRRTIDNIILPALKEGLATVRGPIVFHHGGNPMVPSLNDYLDLPGVVGYAVDHRDSLTEARTILGAERVLLGNLNGPPLAKLAVHTVLEKVDTILEDRRDDPRFIFLSAGADIPLSTPPELLQAICRRIIAFRGNQ
jgi:uroporphyrinogen decarboxylase